jgi:rhodanese-related sulfurtransferase
MPEIQQLDNAALEKLVAETPDLQLIDVRTPAEFFSLGHLTNAQLMPIQTFIDTWSQLDASKPVALVCQHGVRSMAAATWLQDQGFSQIYNLTHGMAEWDGGLAD